MTGQRLCRNPDCRKPIDPERVERYDATVCDDICRAKAWKAEVGYGHQDPARRPSAPVRTASRKPSGLQLPYRKAVQVLADYLHVDGEHPDRAERAAELILRDALPARQLARLEDSERPTPAPQPTPLPLPTPTPAPTPTTAPDLDPAAQTEPEVRILQRQRDDYDTPRWVEIDRIRTRAQPGVALTAWLEAEDQDPLPGSYRAEASDGTSAETTYRTQAA